MWIGWSFRSFTSTMNCLHKLIIPFLVGASPLAGYGQSTSPSGMPELKRRNETPNYILQMFDEHLGEDKVEKTCVLVSTLGAYHLVTQFRRFDSNQVHRAVLDGTLSQASLTSLRAVLDSPELTNWPDEAPPKALAVPLGGDSFLTQLSIPRDGKIQRLTVWKSLVSGGAVPDHGTKLLNPLRDWLKANVNNDRARPSLHPANMRCGP
jgi:hypothetical protein